LDLELERGLDKGSLLCHGSLAKDDFWEKWAKMEKVVGGRNKKFKAKFPSILLMANKI